MLKERKRAMGSPQQWREWNLEGLEVTQLRFDFQFHVQIDSSERSLQITLSSPIILRSDMDAPLLLDPEQTYTLSPLLSLLFKPVVSFRASSDGDCHLRFQNGAELSCAPDERYEAWESHGTGELASASLLCGPGGGSPWG
jgi:hypothetical protein